MMGGTSPVDTLFKAINYEHCLAANTILSRTLDIKRTEPIVGKIVVQILNSVPSSLFSRADARHIFLYYTELVSAFGCNWKYAATSLRVNSVDPIDTLGHSRQLRAGYPPVV